MDGNKYTADIITGIIVLSWTGSDEQLDLKRDICILVNGESDNKDKISRFGISNETVMKPQYVHSAAAIYIMLKYPGLRKDDSFIHIVLKSNLEEPCLKIATDVLSADPDGLNFINLGDSIFNSDSDVILVDENKL